MPAASAAAPPPPRRTGGTPPPDLGFWAPFRDPPPPTPPPLPATEVGTLLKSSEEDHTPDLKRSDAAPGSERTPGSSDFFLRKPESSEKKTRLAHEAFTTEQYYQMAAQVVVHLDLKYGKPPKRDKMVLAFGEPVEGKVHAWEEVWSAVAARWESEKAPLIGLDTPPSTSSSLIGSCIAEQDIEDTCVAKTIISEPHSNKNHVDSQKSNGGEEATGNPPLIGLDTPPSTSSSLIGSCIAEQDIEDTCVAKDVISEPHSNETHAADGGEEASGNLDYDGSARIEPVKLDLGFEAVSYSDKVDQILFDDGNNLKKITARGWQTLLESPCCRSGTSNISSPIQGLTEQDWCVKCGKDGQLLKCYSCSLAAHRSCLGSFVRFNDSGEFCCPVCYHKTAVEEHEKSKKIYADARKNLYAFFGSKQAAKEHSNHQSEADNPSCKDGDPGHEKRNATTDACPEEGVTEKTTTFGPHYGNGKSHEVRSSSPSHEAPHQSQNGFTPAANHSPSYRKVRFQENKTSNSYGKQSGRQNQYVQSPARKRYYPYPPESCYTPARSPLAPTRKSFVSTARRTRLLWTGEEEAALREAVARFAPKDKGNIPWVQIREYGKDMFQPSRLPNDLRQKWNYMKKKKDEIHEGPSFAGFDQRTRRASIPPIWTMREEARKDSEGLSGLG